MRIACPGCAAEYEVPDAALASGPRLLRCARCAHSFQAALPGAPAGAPGAVRAAGPVPPPESAPAPTMPELTAEGPATPRPPPTRGPQRHVPIDPPMGEQAPEERRDARAGGAGLAAAWVLSVAVLLGGIWAGYEWRAEVIAAWPPASRLYQGLGIEPAAP